MCVTVTLPLPLRLLLLLLLLLLVAVVVVARFLRRKGCVSSLASLASTAVAPAWCK